MADTPSTDRPPPQTAGTARRWGVAGIVDGAISGLNAIGTAWIFAIMVAINTDVFSRFLFDAPVSGVPLVIELSIVVIVFVQLAAALRGGRMTRSDVLIARLLTARPMLGRTLQAVYHFGGAVLMAAIFYYVLPLFEKTLRRGTYAGLEADFTLLVWPFKLLVLIGAGFCAFQFLRACWADLEFLAAQRRAAQPGAARPADRARRDGGGLRGLSGARRNTRSDRCPDRADLGAVRPVPGLCRGACRGRACPVVLRLRLDHPRQCRDRRQAAGAGRGGGTPALRVRGHPALRPDGVAGQRLRYGEGYLRCRQSCVPARQGGARHRDGRRQRRVRRRHRDLDRVGVGVHQGGGARDAAAGLPPPLRGRRGRGLVGARHADPAEPVAHPVRHPRRDLDRRFVHRRYRPWHPVVAGLLRPDLVHGPPLPRPGGIARNLRARDPVEHVEHGNPGEDRPDRLPDRDRPRRHLWRRVHRDRGGRRRRAGRPGRDDYQAETHLALVVARAIGNRTRHRGDLFPAARGAIVFADDRDVRHSPM